MTHCEVFRTLLAVSLAALVCGHGMLLDPPSRNSAWRVGFDIPKNWNDNEQNCGGFATQWNTNNGRCGVCGDPFNAKKQEHIHPGKYATGTVTRTYSRGQTIKVRVRITTNHKGDFIFRVGELVTKPITQTQLTHTLELVGGGTKWPLPQGNKDFFVDLKLPKDLSCDHCVMQWWYSAGNNWGCANPKDCSVGSGRQESFVNCADIRIRP